MAPTGFRFDDQPQLAGFVDIALLVFDKLSQHVFRKRGDRVAHFPDFGVVLPFVQDVDIFRLERPQADQFALHRIGHGTPRLQ